MTDIQKKIVIFDDSPQFLSSVVEFINTNLKSKGIIAEGYTNSLAAFEASLDPRTHVLLTDLSISPRLQQDDIASGQDLVERVLQHRRKSIQIAYMSGWQIAGQPLDKVLPRFLKDPDQSERQLYDVLDKDAMASDPTAFIGAVESLMDKVQLPKHPYFVVVTGSSGSGKTTVTRFMRYSIPNLVEILSYTTRDLREGDLQLHLPATFRSPTHIHIDDKIMDEKIKNAVNPAIWMNGPYRYMVDMNDIKIAKQAGHNVMTVTANLDAINQYLDFDPTTFIVYFEVPRETRRQWMTEQGRSKEEIQARLKQEGLNRHKYQSIADAVFHPIIDEPGREIDPQHNINFLSTRFYNMFNWATDNVPAEKKEELHQFYAEKTAAQLVGVSRRPVPGDRFTIPDFIYEKFIEDARRIFRQTDIINAALTARELQVVGVTDEKNVFEISVTPQDLIGKSAEYARSLPYRQMAAGMIYYDLYAKGHVPIRQPVLSGFPDIASEIDILQRAVRSFNRDQKSFMEDQQKAAVQQDLALLYGLTDLPIMDTRSSQKAGTPPKFKQLEIIIE